VLSATGKSLIEPISDARRPVRPYGAAGAQIVLMLWAYYSEQICLFGAELTKAFADKRGPADRRVGNENLIGHESI
jgi:membrane protein